MTIDNKGRRVFTAGRFVLGLAAVVPRMSRMNGIYREYTSPFATSQNSDSRGVAYGFPVEQPLDVNGQITRRDEAANRNGILEVSRGVTKVKRSKVSVGLLCELSAIWGGGENRK